MSIVEKPGRIILFTIFSLMVGCATYHEVPMDSATIDTELKPPDLNTIRELTNDFQHPAIQQIIFDERDGLSPEELAVMAVIANPQLKAERDRCGVANAQLLQAGLLPNPQFATGLDIPSGNGSMPDLYTGSVFDLSWDVTSLITHPAEHRAAKAESESVRLDVAWQEWQAAQAARLHAYRLLNLRQQLAVACELEADGQERLTLAKRAAAEHRLTAVDLTTAEEIALQGQNTRLAIEQDLGTEEADLKLAVGVPPDTTLPIQSVSIDLSKAPSGVVLAKDWVGEIEQQRLDLLALRQGYTSQEEHVRAAIRSQFPAINIGGTWTRDTGNVKSIGLGVSIDLPIFDRGQGRVAMERATRKLLFDDYTARVAETRAQIALLGSQMDFVLKQWAANHAGIGAIDQQIAAAKSAYDEGRLDAASYFDLKGQLLNRRLDELSKQNEWIDLRLALELAAGRPIAPDFDM